MITGSQSTFKMQSLRTARLQNDEVLGRPALEEVRKQLRGRGRDMKSEEDGRGGGGRVPQVWRQGRRRRRVWCKEAAPRWTGA